MYVYCMHFSFQSLIFTLFMVQQPSAKLQTLSGFALPQIIDIVYENTAMNLLIRLTCCQTLVTKHLFFLLVDWLVYLFLLGSQAYHARFVECCCSQAVQKYGPEWHSIQQLESTTCAVKFEQTRSNDDVKSTVQLSTDTQTSYNEPSKSHFCQITFYCIQKHFACSLIFQHPRVLQP